MILIDFGEIQLPLFADLRLCWCTTGRNSTSCTFMYMDTNNYQVQQTIPWRHHVLILVPFCSEVSLVFQDGAGQKISWFLQLWGIISQLFVDGFLRFKGLWCHMFLLSPAGYLVKSGRLSLNFGWTPYQSCEGCFCCDAPCPGCFADKKRRAMFARQDWSP